MRKPNFIFIMTDEQNLRSLSCYKGTVCRTPNIDRMAAEGVLFENACCTNPVCMPSRGIFMTGRYSHTNGLRVNGLTLPETELSLPEIFKSSGYTTGLCGKDHCFSSRQRAEFFDEYSMPAMHLGITEELPPKYSAEARAAQAFYKKELREKVFSPLGNCALPFAPEHCDEGLITSAAVDFVEKNSNSPFFLWLSYPGPHWPFVCPEEYADFVPPEMVDMPPGAESGVKPAHQDMFRRLLALDKAKEADFRQVISKYYGHCRYIDDQIGRVFSKLDELGIDEDTIVFFTSDHGDYLGEHRLMHKSRAVYDCLMMIPYIFRWPGKLKPGQRRPELVNNADLLPTVLDLCGIEIPPTVQGVNLAPALLGDKPFPARPAVFGEYGGEGEAFSEADLSSSRIPDNPYSNAPSDWMGGPPGFQCGRIKMVRTKKWKFGYYPEKTHELYDLENDPWEQHNLYGDPQYDSIVHELMEMLLQWQIDTEDTTPPLPLSKVKKSNLPPSAKYTWNVAANKWTAKPEKSSDLFN